MSLRLKMVVALAALAVAATMAIGIASYSSTRHEFRSRIERSLDLAARSLDERPGLGDPDGTPDNKVNVLLAPGDCFGHPGHMRIGFAQQAEDFDIALARIAAALDRL